MTQTPATSGAWLPADAVLAACRAFRGAEIAKARNRRAERAIDLMWTAPWWRPWRDYNRAEAERLVGDAPDWATIRYCGDYRHTVCQALEALALAAHKSRRPVWVTSRDAAALAGCWPS